MARFITFLSDYGLQDEFVGTCHGVMKRIAPDVQIVHLTHGIPPQNVLHGALVLAKSLEYVPTGVHLAVVDPGVGTARRAFPRQSSGRRSIPRSSSGSRSRSRRSPPPASAPPLSRSTASGTCSSTSAATSSARP